MALAPVNCRLFTSDGAERLCFCRLAAVKTLVETRLLARSCSALIFCRVLMSKQISRARLNAVSGSRFRASFIFKKPQNNVTNPPSLLTNVR